jgi:hypothetical protein
MEPIGKSANPQGLIIRISRVKEFNMPMVNGKKYSYTAKGMEMAKKAAAKSGKPMKMTKAKKKK